ncbi:MAG: glycosyltransferase, partial [Alphaproteobacteria bacterium]|nr:glycosyltransferase [Alphaproteobacteria bacterium]
MSIKVSVLMPIYRTQESYLRTAIESILNQTYWDYEFLILDDCPEDDREDIVKSYNDPRIVYMRNDKNLGITRSRNKLIELAKGDYLATMDHDDISLPTRFEKQVVYLDT